MKQIHHSSLERRTGSIWKPVIFYGLEITFFLLVVSLLELNPDPSTWSTISYGAIVVWIAYVTRKLIRVLGRHSFPHHHSAAH